MDGSVFGFGMGINGRDFVDLALLSGKVRAFRN